MVQIAAAAFLAEQLVELAGPVDDDARQFVRRRRTAALICAVAFGMLAREAVR